MTTGPDFSGSGRTAGGPFWGVNGTAVAGIIAGHGHGTGHADGILGIAPAAKILSIRVTLEYNDPLNSDQAVARKLPGAIAAGITYAVDHGARIIELPMDPGTGGLTGQGNPAAAGGSQAEQAAVANALSKDVILVAPAGDDGEGADLVDYPAAYPGVIAVGCGRQGRAGRPVQQQALLRDPDRARRQPDGRDAARRLRAGQLHQHVERHRGRRGRARPVQVPAPHRRPGQPGAGRERDPGPHATPRRRARHHRRGPGGQPGRGPQPGGPEPTATPTPSHKPQRLSTTAAHQANASSVASSLVRYVVAGLGVLIALLVIAAPGHALPAGKGPGGGRGRRGRGRAGPGRAASTSTASRSLPAGTVAGHHRARRAEPAAAAPAGPGQSRPAAPPDRRQLDGHRGLHRRRPG